MDADGGSTQPLPEGCVAWRVIRVFGLVWVPRELRLTFRIEQRTAASHIVLTPPAAFALRERLQAQRVDGAPQRLPLHQAMADQD